MRSGHTSAEAILSSPKPRRYFSSTTGTFMIHKKNLAYTAAVFALAMAMANAAHATRITGAANASVDDITLGSGNGAHFADAMAYSDKNPAKGAAGNTAGFQSAFASDLYGIGAWSLLGKVEGGSVSDVGSDLFSFSFDLGTGKAGTWSITNNSTSKDVTLDLTFAMHASDASTAFLFDEQTLMAGQTVQGTWKIEWLKSGNVPGFSNLALFAREISYSPAALPGSPAAGIPALPVPEPASWAMMLTGLGLIGLCRRRAAQRAPLFTPV